MIYLLHTLRYLVITGVAARKFECSKLAFFIFYVCHTSQVAVVDCYIELCTFLFIISYLLLSCTPNLFWPFYSKIAILRIALVRSRFDFFEHFNCILTIPLGKVIRLQLYLSICLSTVQYYHKDYLRVRCLSSPRALTSSSGIG